MERMTAKDAAELIFDAWIEMGDEGMSQAQTLNETRLTPKQFKNGKDWLREHLCIDNIQPFTYDPRVNVYRLNTEAERVEEYWLYRLRITARQMEQLLNGTGGPAKQKFKNRKFNRLFRNTENILEDIKDILEGAV